MDRKISDSIDSLRSAAELLQTQGGRQLDPEVIARISDITRQLDFELQRLQELHLEREYLDASRIEGVIAALNEIGRASSELRNALSHRLAEHEMTGRPRTSLRWAEKWGKDSTLAERSFSVIAGFDTIRGDFHEIAPFIPHLRLDDLDRSIAELYYYYEYPQARIAGIVNLSQPTVGNRLDRIDRTVGECVLAFRLLESCRREGWSWLREPAGMRGSPKLDLVLIRQRRNLSDEQEFVGVETHVSLDKATRGAGLLQKLYAVRSRSEILDQEFPGIVPVLAVYRVASNDFAIFPLEELIEIAGQGASIDIERVLTSLPADPSIDMALMRAAKLRGLTKWKEDDDRADK